MAAGDWIWLRGWGRRCPGEPGLPGPGPGPVAPLLLLLLLLSPGPVAADITDGNSEHLKREHSLIKPYQGEAWAGPGRGAGGPGPSPVPARAGGEGEGSRRGVLARGRPWRTWPRFARSLHTGVGSSAMPLWDFQGSTMLTSQYVRLTPDERSKEGAIWNRQVRGSRETRAEA